MRILVTGANGFVGSYFVAGLRTVDQNVEVFAATAPNGCEGEAKKLVVEIRDESAVGKLIASIRPTHVMHLAAVSTLSDATVDPKRAWETNVFGTINLARAILKSVPDCVLIFAGSGEVYGASANDHRPLDEQVVLQPVSEYAVTKAAADLALGAMTRAGLRSVRFRPFNHIGPGQTDKFAVSSFAAQIARIEAKLQPPVIRVGNLESERDFLDVRDVVQAYIKSIFRSGEIAPGEIFNLASGQVVRISTILDQLLELSEVRITVERDPNLIRPTEIKIVQGDANKARRLLDWHPIYDLQQTVSEMLTNWRRTVQG